MAAMRIALDEGVPENNHAKLTGDGSLVPAGDIIQQVHGDGAEPTSLLFLRRLQKAAEVVGSHTDAVRAAVQQNADALKAAAAALQESDEAGAADLSATTTIIDQTAADTTSEDVASAEQFLDEEAARRTAEEEAAKAEIARDEEAASAAAGGATSPAQEGATGPDL